MIEIKIQTNPYPLPLGIKVRDEILKLELEIIKCALERHKGNVYATSIAIGMNRNTIFRKCRDNNIDLGYYRNAE